MLTINTSLDKVLDEAVAAQTKYLAIEASYVATGRERDLSASEHRQWERAMDDYRLALTDAISALAEELNTSYMLRRL